MYGWPIRTAPRTVAATPEPGPIWASTLELELCRPVGASSARGATVVVVGGGFAGVACANTAIDAEANNVAIRADSVFIVLFS